MHDRLAVDLLRQERRRRGGCQADQRGQLVGAVADPVAVEAQDLAGALSGVEDRAGEDRRARPGGAWYVERGRDAEVPAAAAQAPEQLAVLVLARVHQTTVGGDHVGRHQVVAGQAVLAHEPTDAAAEREAGDAGARHEPAGHGQAEGLRLVVELGPGEARLRGCGLRLHVDADALHRREVDHDPAVAGGEAGDAVCRRRGRRRAASRCGRTPPRASRLRRRRSGRSAPGGGRGRRSRSSGPRRSRCRRGR